MDIFPLNQFFVIIIEIRCDLPYGMWYIVKNTKIFWERGMAEKAKFPMEIRILWK